MDDPLYHLTASHLPRTITRSHVVAIVAATEITPKRWENGTEKSPRPDIARR